MTDLTKALRIRQTENLGFVLVRHGLEIARGSASSTHELFAAVERLGAQACGASLADKVVGMAVAMIAAHAGIIEVHARLMSRLAVPVLQAHGIRWQADVLVPAIMNHQNDGLCPLEQLAHGLESPPAAIAALREFFAARGTMSELAPPD